MEPIAKWIARSWLVAPVALVVVASLVGCDAIQKTLPEGVRTALNTPAPLPPPDVALYKDRKLFACCNLHYLRDDISDSNYTSAEMIRAGTPVRVTEFNSDGRNLAWIEADGRRYRMIHDWGARRGESFQQYLDKMLLAHDPQVAISGYPAGVRDAIRAGRVTLGMTREQVLVSLGYPSPSDTPKLAEPVWLYWLGRFDPFEVVFDDKGRVHEVTGLMAVRNQVLLTSRR